MDNSINITVIAHFNGSIIKNTEEGMVFLFDELLIIFVPQTISFEKLNVVFCQGINTGTLKTVVRIRYRCPISNLNNKIQFRPVKISSDREMQIMFRTYRQYLQHITVIELYVDFKEIVTKTGRASLHLNKNVQSVYLARRHEDTVPSSYQVSHVIVIKFFISKLVM